MAIQCHLHLFAAKFVTGTLGGTRSDLCQPAMAASSGCPGVADTLFPPGEDLPVAIVAVAKGSWNSWMDNSLPRGRPQRRAAAAAVDADLLAGPGDGPAELPAAPSIV